jgi:DNA repair exonuclease SbcCD ATPase subunit
MFTLTIVNFKVYDNYQINFPVKGLYLLDGKSGKGKTSILEAIKFVLYGGNRNIYPRHLRNKAKIPTKVWLEKKNGNTVELVIYRQKRSDLLVVQQGDLVLKDAVAQDFIDKNFGTETDWEAGCYLEQGEKCKFFSMKEEERLEVLHKISLPSNYNQLIEKVVNKIQETKALISQEEINTNSKYSVYSYAYNSIPPEVRENTPPSLDDITVFLNQNGGTGSYLTKEIFDSVNRDYSDNITKLDQELFDVKHKKKQLCVYQLELDTTRSKLESLGETKLRGNIETLQKETNGIQAWGPKEWDKMCVDLGLDYIPQIYKGDPNMTNVMIRISNHLMGIKQDLTLRQELQDKLALLINDRNNREALDKELNLVLIKYKLAQKAIDSNASRKDKQDKIEKLTSEIGNYIFLCEPWTESELVATAREYGVCTSYTPNNDLIIDRLKSAEHELRDSLEKLSLTDSNIERYSIKLDTLGVSPYELSDLEYIKEQPTIEVIDDELSKISSSFSYRSRKQLEAQYFELKTEQNKYQSIDLTEEISRLRKKLTMLELQRTVMECPRCQTKLIVTGNSLSEIIIEDSSSLNEVKDKLGELERKQKTYHLYLAIGNRLQELDRNILGIKAVPFDPLPECNYLEAYQEKLFLIKHKLNKLKSKYDTDISSINVDLEIEKIINYNELKKVKETKLELVTKIKTTSDKFMPLSKRKNNDRLSLNEIITEIKMQEKNFIRQKLLLSIEPEIKVDDINMLQEVVDSLRIKLQNFSEKYVYDSRIGDIRINIQNIDTRLSRLNNLNLLVSDYSCDKIYDQLKLLELDRLLKICSSSVFTEMKNKIKELEGIVSGLVLETNDDVIADLTSRKTRYSNMLKTFNDKFSIYARLLQLHNLRTEWHESANRLDYWKSRLSSLEKIKATIGRCEYALLETFLSTLNDRINDTMLNMFSENISFRIVSFHENKNGTIKPKISYKLSLDDQECTSIKDVSGGQAGRISLSLAIALSSMSNNPFLLLDESLSNLDLETKQMVIDELTQKLPNKLIISVNHDTNHGMYDHVITLE